jgi:hypothetical protein
MAKIPTIRRLTIEDFPSQKDWILPLLEILNNFIINVIVAFNKQLTISENVLGQISTFRVQTNEGYTLSDGQPTDQSVTFVDADVNTGTEVITITAHGFSTGDKIQMSTTGVLPVPFAIQTDYWVISTGANTLQIASSLANAFAGTPINITSAAGGGTHTMTRWIDGAPYVGLFELPKFSINFKAAPVLVTVGKIVEVATNPAIIRESVSLDWSYSNGLVTINHVTGLLPSKQYDVTVSVWGG